MVQQGLGTRLGTMCTRHCFCIAGGAAVSAPQGADGAWLEEGEGGGGGGNEAAEGLCQSTAQEVGERAPGRDARVRGAAGAHAGTRVPVPLPPAPLGPSTPCPPSPVPLPGPPARMHPRTEDVLGHQTPTMLGTLPSRLPPSAGWGQPLGGQGWPYSTGQPSQRTQIASGTTYHDRNHHTVESSGKYTLIMQLKPFSPLGISGFVQGGHQNHSSSIAAHGWRCLFFAQIDVERLPSSKRIFICHTARCWLGANSPSFTRGQLLWVDWAPSRPCSQPQHPADPTPLHSCADVVRFGGGAGGHGAGGAAVDAGLGGARPMLLPPICPFPHP